MYLAGLPGRLVRTLVQLVGCNVVRHEMIPACFRAGGGELVYIFPLFFKGFFLRVGKSQSGAARPEVHNPRPVRLPMSAIRPI